MLSIAYLLGLLVVWAIMHWLADVWWVGTVLIYAPRWVWLAPLIPLAGLTAWLSRLYLAFVALGAVWVIGPIMGFNVPSPSVAFSGERGDLRVVTSNVGGGSPISPERLSRFLKTNQADIAFLQECDTDVSPLKAEGWHTHTTTKMCFLSRFPILKIDSRDRQEIWEMNGMGAIDRYELDGPKGVISVLNVHLETVREGLAAVVRLRAWLGIEEMEKNIEQRRLESKLAFEWSQRSLTPPIIAGDFNLPVESAIYRELWGRFTNAFSFAGLGFGNTKFTRWHGVRIDHVLVAPQGWRVMNARVGESVGYDHKPLIVELRPKTN